MSDAVQWLIAAVVAILAVEALLRLPVVALALKLKGLAGRTTAIMRSSRISDHWKEQALPAYARRMMAINLKLAGALLVLAATVLFPVLLADMAIPSTVEFAFSLSGIVAITAFALIYGFFRFRRV